jgi:hypothetical protein
MNSPLLESQGKVEDSLDQEITPSFIEASNTITKLINSIPKDIVGEDYRIACCVVTGCLRGRSLSELIKYYSVDNDRALYWWDHFGFSNIAVTEKKKRGQKTATLESFVKSNIGKTYKSTEILALCNITNPTLYNFINANRGYFKKVGRGQYEIVDMESQRVKEKSI